MIVKPAMLSGVATVSTYWLWVFIDDIVHHRLSEITVSAVVIATPLLWVIGSAISLFCLLILHPIYKRTSRKLSLIIFSLFGFIYATYPEIWMCLTPMNDHPALIIRNTFKALIRISEEGVLGLSTAIAAWYFLGKNKGEEQTDAGHSSWLGSSITICNKKLKFAQIVSGVVIAVVVAFYCLIWHPTRMFVADMAQWGVIYNEKAEKFINLPASEHERLIEISRRFHAEKYEEGKYPVFSKTSDGYDEILPQEFVDFGFNKVRLGESKVIGQMYWLVDSGGDAEIDWSNPSQPTITFFQGDGRDIITKVYPKEN